MCVFRSFFASSFWRQLGHMWPREHSVVTDGWSHTLLLPRIKLAFSFPIAASILCLRIDVVLNRESREMGTHRPRCQRSATLRRVPAVIYKVPSVGMRSSSPLAWGNSDREKSLSLIMLHHKSHSHTRVSLTCVHFLLHNDQTQLQPAALGLYPSTRLGATGLCLFRYWKKALAFPFFSPSVTFICPLQFLFTSRLPFVPPPLQPRPL